MDVPRGEKIGCEPIFEPDNGDGQTLAEMDFLKKVSSNHHFLSFKKLFEYIDSQRERNAN